MNIDNLSNDQKFQLNQFSQFMQFRVTKPYLWFQKSMSKTKCWFTGNQFGKDASVTHDDILRILGWHPIEEKNIRPHHKIRVFRYCCENLPSECDGQEVRNPIYAEIKKWLPRFLIRKDITTRNNTMIVRDIQGGKDITLEFVSFNQGTQATAGMQRCGIRISESAPKEFCDEQYPRLMASSAEGYHADLIYTLTPTIGQVGWEFDDIFEKTKYIYRTKRVCQRLYDRYREKNQMYEERDSNHDITVIMASSYDNPVIPEKIVEENLQNFDEETRDARGYGIFRQLSGKMYKDFGLLHVIDENRYFPEGLPDNYKYFRTIDFHQSNPWAVSFSMLSPQNELFVFNELMPDPEKMTTLEICKQVARVSFDNKFDINMVDPLAGVKQNNTGLSVLEDMNRIFYQLKREPEYKNFEGGYWIPWDTKNENGMYELRNRMKNSVYCGKPFNNIQVVNGVSRKLPTIWFFNSCRQHILSLKNWHRDENVDSSRLGANERKEKGTQKWSHFPMCLECLLKHPYFKNPVFNVKSVKTEYNRPKQYFQTQQEACI